MAASSPSRRSTPWPALPSKEEIYSKLLFLMNAPAQRLVTVMNAVGRDIAVVINQGVEKSKFGGAPAAGGRSSSGSGSGPAAEAPAEAAPAEAQA